MSLVIFITYLIGQKHQHLTLIKQWWDSDFENKLIVYEKENVRHVH